MIVGSSPEEAETRVKKKIDKVQGRIQRRMERE